ncbi:hypothetical protein SGPA1_50857 [Streptomyces misionensis JCM 4497]
MLNGTRPFYSRRITDGFRAVIDSSPPSLHSPDQECHVRAHHAHRDAPGRGGRFLRKRPWHARPPLARSHRLTRRRPGEAVEGRRRAGVAGAGRGRSHRRSGGRCAGARACGLPTAADGHVRGHPCVLRGERAAEPDRLRRNTGHRLPRRGRGPGSPPRRRRPGHPPAHHPARRGDRAAPPAARRTTDPRAGRPRMVHRHPW